MQYTRQVIRKAQKFLILHVFQPIDEWVYSLKADRSRRRFRRRYHHSQRTESNSWIPHSLRLRFHELHRSYQWARQRQHSPRQRWEPFRPPRKKRKRNLCRLICLQVHRDKSDRPIQFDTDSCPLRVDNCASRCISNRVEDFIDPLQPLHSKLNGIGGTLGDLLVGTAKFIIEDDDGTAHDIIIPNTIYAKDSPSRILSPQHWAQEANDNKPLPRGTWCATYDDAIELHWHQREFKRVLPLDPGSNVAIIYTASGYTHHQAFVTEAGIDLEADDIWCYDTNVVSDDENSDTDSVTSIPDDLEQPTQQSDEGTDFPIQSDDIRQSPLTTEFPLDGPTTNHEPPPVIIEDEEHSRYTDPSAEFLMWHHKLGHASPKKIKQMARLGMLPRRLADCQVPLCTSCLYGKATRRRWRNKPSKLQRESSSPTAPGQVISIDQLESRTPGLIAQLRGIPTTSRYKIATVFVDQFSKFSYVHLQQSTGADETIEALQAFEKICDSHGVIPQHYHADNGIFADNKFKAALASRGRTLTFCGVNAHHQNGIAERRIRDIQDHARTQLIHAKARWPDAITAQLWPYAIRHANDLQNHTINLQTNKVPIECFSRSPVQVNLDQWRHFGCPIYVLDSRLQSGKKIPKWSNRARVAIYLGRSPHHARSVALCLSLETGLTSPQFHVRFDSAFRTTRKGAAFALPESKWQSKCHFTKNNIKENKSHQQDKPQAEATPPEEEGVIPPHGDTMDPPINQPEEENPPPDPDPQVPAPEPTITRSGRRSQAPQRLLEVFATEISTSSVPYEILRDDPIDLMAYAASADPDTMYLHQALKQPDRRQFIEAMVKEVSDQTANGNWRIIQRRHVPSTAKILPAVWAMKRKRRITTQEVYKWKARLNIDGSKQEKGINFWETFAPVASWPIIRLILSLSILRGWHTLQIDYVLAYTQAEAETDKLYMKIPKGFEVPQREANEYVLQILRNIYGQRQASRVWYKHLVSILTSPQVGFKQSKVDECLFYKGNAVYILYTDDSILAGPNPEELKSIVASMQAASLNITVEGDISDFLGVNIERKDDGTVHLTQPQLIDRILDDLKLNQPNQSSKSTPAKSSQILKRHAESPAFDGHFNYRSVIGKMNYLEQSTRPDISYAVHQCARFAADPKREHGRAVTWIGRYLRATRDKGLIFRPDETRGLECWVDADFVGNWDPQESTSADTARSRSGYIAMYAGCPIFWKSKLQTVIALSSTESEYVAASTALRDMIPAMRVLQEMQRLSVESQPHTPIVRCKVFEDNSGAVELLKSDHMRPRTKHICTQFHHFRSYIADSSIVIEPVSTHDQCADILTKPVPEDILLRLRPRIMGW